MVNISNLIENYLPNITVISLEKDSCIYYDRWDGEVELKGRKYSFTCWYEELYSKPYKFTYRIFNQFNEWTKEIEL